MKTQDMTLLCPCCQLTRRATIGIDIKDEPESLKQDTAVNMGLSIMASCPSCGANMYQADDDLVDALKMLNDAGIHTTYHCSTSHPNGGYENDCKRIVHDDPYRRALYERGPHIGIVDMSTEECDHLYRFMKERTKDYTEDEVLRLDYEHEIHATRMMSGKKNIKIDRIELMVMCSKIDTDTLKEACILLTEFIRDWLMSTNGGTLPTGKGKNFKRIANRAYVYPQIIGI